MENDTQIRKMNEEENELIKVIHQAQTDIYVATERLVHHKLLIDNKIESYKGALAITHERIKKLEKEQEDGRPYWCNDCKNLLAEVKGLIKIIKLLGDE